VEYCYTIRAFDAAGNRSAFSARTCAMFPDTAPPSTPGRPNAVPVSSTQLVLAWDASTDDVGVKGYEVLRDGAVVATVPGLQARQPNLRPGQEYCYAVRAFDAAGNRSPATGPFCGKTPAPSEVAGSGLRVQRLSPTSVVLGWEPTEGKRVTYKIYAQGKLVGLTRKNTYAPSGLIAAAASCFRVTVVDDDGKESPKSDEVCLPAADEPVSAK
jgi:hypothetical protein